jgi:hypothetical protein
VIFYLKLQYQLFRRRLLAQAISPRLVLIISLPLFIYLANRIVQYVIYGEHIFFALAIVAILALSSKNRISFLKQTLPKEFVGRIRLVENGLTALPFALFLLYNQFYLLSLFLVIIAIALSKLTFQGIMTCVMPTPFSHHPFEFLIGFRKTFLVFAFAYFLAVMAVISGNVNLGLGALALCYLTCMYFFNKPEPAFYKSLYIHSTVEFIKYKIRVAIIYSALLGAPIFILLGIAFIEDIDLIGLISLLSIGFLVNMVFLKYASFPKDISIANSVLLAVCIPMPPLLLLVTPFLYKKALTNLNQHVDD